MDNQSGNVLVLLKYLVALVLVTGISATSVATTYDVHRVVGSGIISGTIETNGATGVLASTDIIDWNLTVDADGIPATFGLLLGPISGDNSSITFLEGSALTATATALFFDFSLPEMAIFQISTPEYDVVWQLQADIFADELIQEARDNQSFAYPSDKQQLTTAVAVNVVDIDIKPGSDTNCLNMSGHGVVPVAILGSDSLDIANIDQLSLAFGGLDVRIRGKKGALCSGEYSNGDAYLDLVCKFEDDAGAWSPGSEDATLTGTLLDGSEFEGTDTICVVP